MYLNIKNGSKNINLRYNCSGSKKIIVYGPESHNSKTIGVSSSSNEQHHKNEYLNNNFNYLSIIIIIIEFSISKIF